MQAPAHTTKQRRRARAIIGAVLWMLVLVPPTLAPVLIISGLHSVEVAKAIRAATGPVLEDTGDLPEWFFDLGLTNPYLFATMALFGVAVVIAIIASIVTPIAIARKIIAPIVVALAVIPAWFGASEVLDALKYPDTERAATGAMVLGLALAAAIIGVWVGISSTPAGLAAVPLAAFITVLAPLAALGVLGFGPGASNSLADGPARDILGLHWVASAAFVLAAVIAGIILIRAATYRRPR